MPDLTAAIVSFAQSSIASAPLTDQLTTMTGWFFSSRGLLLSIITLFCIVHLFKTRQSPLWLITLLFFPLFGVILYLILVVFASPGAIPRPSLTARQRRNPPDLSRRIAELQRRLAETDTLATRSELAECHLQTGNFTTARELYESCLLGNYATDPLFNYGLAQACHALGDHQTAQTALDRTWRPSFTDYLPQRQLLKGKILEALDQPQDALTAFAAAAPALNSEEGRFRQARLLQQLNRPDEATALFMLILRNCRDKGPVYAEDNQDALRAAQTFIGK